MTPDTMASKRPLLGLWLDSVDYALLRRWMSEGRLPHLEEIFASGLSARLEGLPHSRAEVIQCVAITGASPEASHYWGVHRYDPGTYRVTHGGIYDYRRYPPFFALGPDFRVAALDFPQYNFHDGVHGWQVRNWACHSSMTPTDSRPVELSRALDDEFGIPPMRTHHYAVLQDATDMRRMNAELHQSIDMRTRLIAALVERGPWDLFLANFAEMHKAGHYLVPNPDSRAFVGGDDPWHALREIHEHLDHAIGRLMACCRDRWNVAVYSYEGVCDYSDEVQNTLLLGDLLMRDSFAGRGAFVYDDPTRGPSPEARAGIVNWVMEAWHLRRRPSRFQSWVRTQFGVAVAAAFDARLGLPPYPEHPSASVHCEYQPLVWLEKYRPHMRAFALPTFSDGFIRINVRGREGRGRVDPSAFRDECARLTSLLMDLRDPVSGRLAVKNVIRIRDDPFQTGGERPTADLVVQWEPLGEGNGFVSPTLGSFGPAPSLRASTHSADGFFGAYGPDVPKVAGEIAGHILDVAPTLLDLAGARPPAPLEGRSLLRRDPAKGG